MRQAAVFVALTLASGIAASAQEHIEQRLARCYAEAAVRLDDGKSDARTIASALIFVCYELRLQNVQDMIKHVKPYATPQELGSLANGRREADLDMATVAVLTMRKK